MTSVRAPNLGAQENVQKIRFPSDIAKEKTLEQITEFDKSKLKIAEAAKSTSAETSEPAPVEEEVNSEESSEDSEESE